MLILGVLNNLDNFIAVFCILDNCVFITRFSVVIRSCIPNFVCMLDLYTIVSHQRCFPLPLNAYDDYFNPFYFIWLCCWLYAIFLYVWVGYLVKHILSVPLLITCHFPLLRNYLHVCNQNVTSFLAFYRTRIS